MQNIRRDVPDSSRKRQAAFVVAQEGDFDVVPGQRFCEKRLIRVTNTVVRCEKNS
jgi:hypothetical protein